MVWFGLIWFGLVWFGLVWFDLIWLALAWFGFESEMLAAEASFHLLQDSETCLVHIRDRFVERIEVFLANTIFSRGGGQSRGQTVISDHLRA